MVRNQVMNVYNVYTIIYAIVCIWHFHVVCQHGVNLCNIPWSVGYNIFLSTDSIQVWVNQPWCWWWWLIADAGQMSYIHRLMFDLTNSWDLHPLFNSELQHLVFQRPTALKFCFGITYLLLWERVPGRDWNICFKICQQMTMGSPGWLGGPQFLHDGLKPCTE